MSLILDAAIFYVNESYILPVVYTSYEFYYLYSRNKQNIHNIHNKDYSDFKKAVEEGVALYVINLCKTYNLTTEDIRSDDNWALLWASVNGHLPTVRWICKKYKLSFNEELIVI